MVFGLVESTKGIINALPEEAVALKGMMTLPAFLPATLDLAIDQIRNMITGIKIPLGACAAAFGATSDKKKPREPDDEDHNNSKKGKAMPRELTAEEKILEK